MQSAPETTRQQDEIERREAAPLSFDAETNTIDVVFATGADVLRQDFWTGKRFIERLPLSGLDVSELNAGAAVLNAHNSFDVQNILGSVVPDSARVQKRKATAKIKLSSDPAHAGIVTNIRDGIIRKLSYGYIRLGEPEVTDEKGVEVRTWAAHLAKEISFVPVPADGGTGTRSQPMEEEKMTPEEKKAAEEAKVAEEAKRAKEIETAKAEALEAGRKTENARQTEIRAVAAKLGLGDADMTPLLSDPAVTLEAARATLIDKRAEADKATRIDGHLDMGRADSEKRHEAMAEGLSLRAAYRFGQRKAEKPPEIARDFMYGSLESLARAYLRGIGISQVDSMPTTLIFDVALNFDKRFHSTSDFPLILADAINKNLRAAMAGEALNFEAISTQRNFRDFKLVHELKMGTFTSLALIPEGGNVTYGTIGEGDETWRGFSYGQGWKQTRESMINDDLEAFSRIPAEMLLCINTLKLDLWWSLVTTNAALADTIALFHANHANLAAGADIGAPAAATLGAMREAFRLQTKLGGQRLNLMPSHLIIPANHETAVEQLVTPVSISGFSPAASNVVIPRFVGSLAIIVEPRLDTSSTTRWYAFSRDYIGGSFVHGTLEGAEEPSMLSETDFETRGLKMRVDLDFGCGVTDHRAVYANNGV